MLGLEGEEWWEQTLGGYLSYKAGAWRGRRPMGRVEDLGRLDGMGHVLLRFFLGLQLLTLWAGPFSSENVGFVAVRPVPSGR